jgi:hypothetical protein
VSQLRAVLAAVLAAPPGTGLDRIAERLDLSRDEVEAMVDYWVRRGKLSVRRLRGCSAGGCSPAGGPGCRPGEPGCRPGEPDGAGCPTIGSSRPTIGSAGGSAGDAPALLAIGRPVARR